MAVRANYGAVVVILANSGAKAQKPNWLVAVNDNGAACSRVHTGKGQTAFVINKRNPYF
jgi:hypothetical protein